MCLPSRGEKRARMRRIAELHDEHIDIARHPERGGKPFQFLAQRLVAVVAQHRLEHGERGAQPPQRNPRLMQRFGIVAMRKRRRAMMELTKASARNRLERGRRRHVCRENDPGLASCRAQDRAPRPRTRRPLITVSAQVVANLSLPATADYDDEAPGANMIGFRQRRGYSGETVMTALLTGWTLKTEQ